MLLKFDWNFNMCVINRSVINNFPLSCASHFDLLVIFRNIHTYSSVGPVCSDIQIHTPTHLLRCPLLDPFSCNYFNSSGTDDFFFFCLLFPLCHPVIDAPFALTATLSSPSVSVPSSLSQRSISCPVGV